LLPWKDIPACLAIYRALRRIRPHIVHTHSSKAGILGRLAAYMAGVPVIIHTFHGFGFTPLQSRPVRQLMTAIERCTAKLSTFLVYVSNDNQAEAKAVRIKAREGQTLIRSGIALKPTPSDGLRGELSVPESAFLVACINNFKPQKNPKDLIETALRLVASDAEIHVAIAGDGPGRGGAQAAVQGKPGADRIHFLGWRMDARRLQAAADVFLLTSAFEGLPRALVEAFAEGQPAVAYAVNGVRDILRDGENGFSIEPGQTEQAAEKVLWLKAHPAEGRRMGEAGRTLIRKEFDIDRMVRQQEELYGRLYDEVPLRSLYEPAWK
jgi:glycosyltransferase involved in cell wall biosynthesis